MGNEKENGLSKIAVGTVTAVVTSFVVLFLYKPFERYWSPTKQISYTVSEPLVILQPSLATNLGFNLVYRQGKVTNGIINQISGYNVSFKNSGSDTIEDLTIVFSTTDESRIFTVSGKGPDRRTFGEIHAARDVSDQESEWRIKYLNSGHEIPLFVVAEGSQNLSIDVLGKGIKVKKDDRRSSFRMYIGAIALGLLSAFVYTAFRKKRWKEDAKWELTHSNG